MCLIHTVSYTSVRVSHIYQSRLFISSYQSTLSYRVFHIERTHTSRLRPYTTSYTHTSYNNPQSTVNLISLSNILVYQIFASIIPNLSPTRKPNERTIGTHGHHIHRVVPLQLGKSICPSNLLQKNVINLAQCTLLFEHFYYKFTRYFSVAKWAEHPVHDIWLLFTRDIIVYNFRVKSLSVANKIDSRLKLNSMV